MGKETVTLEERTIRKVTFRLLPFLFILYVVAFLDRVNFGYAALEMNSALSISAEAFGFLSGIFFIGYLLFEIPSNLIIKKIGARIWISRIMISWGIVVIITAAAASAWQLAILRFVLGIAEAGFFPGLIFYITLWFRERELARAVALFMTALAVSNIIGAPVSTWILENISWLGISGWRWLFVLEGLPAIILGIATWFYLTDRPSGAHWLDDDERAWLVRELADEETRRLQSGASATFRGVLADRSVWILGIGYSLVTVGLYGLGFWMPLIIRSLNPAFSDFQIGLFMVIPFAVAFACMILWSRHSDRSGERRWHTALPPILGGASLAGAGLALASDPVLAFCLLVLATAGIYSFFGPFWTLPAIFLTETVSALGIAVINSVGNIGGFAGPSLLGIVVKTTGGTGIGLVAIGGCLVLSGILVVIAGRSKLYNQ